MYCIGRRGLGIYLALLMCSCIGCNSYVDSLFSRCDHIDVSAMASGTDGETVVRNFSISKADVSVFRNHIGDVQIVDSITLSSPEPAISLTLIASDGSRIIEMMYTKTDSIKAGDQTLVLKSNSSYHFLIELASNLKLNDSWKPIYKK